MSLIVNHIVPHSHRKGAVGLQSTLNHIAKVDCYSYVTV